MLICSSVKHSVCRKEKQAILVKYNNVKTSNNESLVWMRKRSERRLEREKGGKTSETFVPWKNPPYSGTCPVPLFSSSLTRLPPALMSSMARAWVMSRVLSPLISMIWSPTCRRHTDRGRGRFLSASVYPRRVDFSAQPQSADGEKPGNKCH